MAYLFRSARIALGAALLVFGVDDLGCKPWEGIVRHREEKKDIKLCGARDERARETDAISTRQPAAFLGLGISIRTCWGRSDHTQEPEPQEQRGNQRKRADDPLRPKRRTSLQCGDAPNTRHDEHHEEREAPPPNANEKVTRSAKQVHEQTPETRSV